MACSDRASTLKVKHLIYNEKAKCFELELEIGYDGSPLIKDALHNLKLITTLNIALAKVAPTSFVQLRPED